MCLPPLYFHKAQKSAILNSNTPNGAPLKEKFRVSCPWDFLASGSVMASFSQMLTSSQKEASAAEKGQAPGNWSSGSLSQAPPPSKLASFTQQPLFAYCLQNTSRQIWVTHRALGCFWAAQVSSRNLTQFLMDREYWGVEGKHGPQLVEGLSWLCMAGEGGAGEASLQKPWRKQHQICANLGKGPSRRSWFLYHE